MISMIVLAGGSGTRMNKDLPKQFLLLGGKPVIMHTLERIDKIKKIREVLIVCLEEYFDYINDYILKYNLSKKYKLIKGGKSRQESVFNGLNYAQFETVIIHEAARPFVTTQDFNEIIEESHKNVTYAKNISFTVLHHNLNYISGILDRETLVNIQLPQKFDRAKLINAHRKALEESRTFSEDASLLYYYEKCNIFTLEGQDYNIKLTNYLDLIIAEEIYKEQMVNR